LTKTLELDFTETGTDARVKKRRSKSRVNEAESRDCLSYEQLQARVRRLHQVTGAQSWRDLPRDVVSTGMQRAQVAHIGP
jgi:hypothetical protein